MSKETKRKIKNGIIKTLTVLNVISAVLSACCLDNPSKVPCLIFGANLIFLILVMYANY
jgi:hypothetical protein